MADLITIITVASVVIYIGIELKILQPYRIRKLMSDRGEWILKKKVKTKCLSEELALKIPYYLCMVCSRLYELDDNEEKFEKCSCGMEWRLIKIRNQDVIIKVGG